MAREDTRASEVAGGRCESAPRRASCGLVAVADAKTIGDGRGGRRSLQLEPKRSQVGRLARLRNRELIETISSERLPSGNLHDHRHHRRR